MTASTERSPQMTAQQMLSGGEQKRKNRKNQRGMKKNTERVGVGKGSGKDDAAETHQTSRSVCLQEQRGGGRDPLSLKEETEPPH